MESELLKLLLIAGDTQFASAVANKLQAERPLTEIVAETALDAGLARLSGQSFDVVLFELPSANAAGLFQVTFLATKAPTVPVVVFGPGQDEAFPIEVVRAGAQEYFSKEQLNQRALEPVIRSALERHLEQAALLKEKENYYGIFDHLVEGIFRTTPDGHYLLANIALARIYGYDSPVELMASIKDIGRSLYVDPARREEFVRLMQTNDTITDFESQIYRKDGSIIWISENCRAVRDAQGKLIYYEGTVQDITEHQHTEMRLRNSEALYHSLVETMPQNVFRKDLQGRFTFANQQYCKHYNCKLEDILGKTDFDFFPKELAEKYQKDDERVMETGQTYEITEEHHPFGQEKTIARVVKTPLYSADGSIIGLQGIFWDVTEQVRADEQIRQVNAELARSREELRTKNLLMEESLQMAREIQFATLPQQYPAFPSNVLAEQSAFQFVHRYQPAETVSGDFFSISALSEDEVGVFICDVTGHGVRAALVTAMIRALVEELKPAARDPGLFLRKVNADLFTILKTTGSPTLTTAFYLVANWRTGVMCFANAGHPKPLLMRRSTASVEPLANASGKSQPALGLFEDPPYQTSEITIAPGDFVMLFTDGLYEVQGPNEELYSPERLIMDVKDRLPMPASQLFDELLGAISLFSVDHEFADDVCMVGIEFKGKPA
ncbi:MAG TPA: SpoIIE family protein phosphatase [Candidatus Saccharimonadales bacterium]|nr:SpoIIE family protein phosphatase [Candidatus Saccharimonadales bacterium]